MDVLIVWCCCCCCFIGVVLNSTECISLFVKIGVNDPQAIISIQFMLGMYNALQFMKLTALYTANMNGGERLLRKS